MKFIQLAEQNYFLRQGELDRACGPYAVVMALLALGVIERDDLDECVGWRMDRRTKLFKLFNEFDSCSSLFFNGGTFRDKLAQAIVGGFSKEVDIFFFEEGDFEQRLAFVVNSIEEGRVVVMMVSLDGVLHWVVGVGFSESIIYKKLYILAWLSPQLSIGYGA